MAATLALFAVAAPAATLTTRVELTDSRQSSVRKRDFSGVAVWLEPVGRAAPLPPPRVYTMLQKNKRFIPHVLAIPLGSTVDFPNLDPIFHNAFSNFAGQPFDVGLYPPGTTQKVTFRRDGIVRVFCNIHSTMSAVVLVLKTPFFGVSARTGEIKIANIPDGEYDLRIWHERAADGALKALERRIQVKGGDVALPPIVVSESGFLEVEHTNKHGHDYGPEPQDRAGYRGGKR